MLKRIIFGKLIWLPLKQWSPGGGVIVTNLNGEGCMRISQQQLVTWEASQGLLGTRKENGGHVYGCGRFQEISGCLLTSSEEFREIKCKSCKVSLTRALFLYE